jgi:hypothetical protein
MQFIVLAGLAYDLALYRYGFTTISGFCQRHLWAGAIVVILKAIGTFGLAMHFFAKNGGH